MSHEQYDGYKRLWACVLLTAFRDIKNHPDVTGNTTLKDWQYSDRLKPVEAYRVAHNAAMFWIQSSKMFDWVCENLDMNPNYLRGCALSKVGRDRVIAKFARFESTRKYYGRKEEIPEESSEEDSEVEDSEGG